MLLGFVPLAEPEDVLGRGVDLAQWTLLDLSGLPKLYSSLNPSAEVMLALGWQCLLHLMIRVPVNACDEVMVEGSAGNSVDALVLGFR